MGVATLDSSAGLGLLHPRSADNASLGLSLSLLAHVLLVLALSFGVQWRTQTPPAVSAELWSSVPQVAAPERVDPVERTAPRETPRPPPTAERDAVPPKRDADIAVDKAEQRRKDKERKAEQARQAEEDRLARKKAQAKAERDAQEQEQRDQEQRERLHQDQIRRMQQQLGMTGAKGSSAQGTAAADAGQSAAYAGRIKARIKPNIVLTDDVAGNPTAEVEVQVLPDGTIRDRRIVKSSGVKAWDDAVLRAIDRTQTLPRDTDGRVPPSLVIAFRPRE